jgi:diguanylate cyclase (GGDEF)-like protein
MDFTEYKIGYYKRWQKRILGISWTMFITVFALEIFVGLVPLIYGNLPPTSCYYCIKHIVLPSSMNFICLVIATLLVSSPVLTIVQKNYTVLFLFLAIVAVVSFFHNYYQIVFLLPCAALFIAALLTDKKLLRTIFISAMVVAVFSLLQWFFTKTGDSLKLKIGTAVAVVAIHCASYYFSNAILFSVQEQIDFIYDGYLKQQQLLDELQLEPLTRLYNRAALAEAVSSCIKTYKETDGLLMLALIDLDNFKNVNDKYGHASGDVVLIAFAELIIKILGGSRNVFRYGGDEFVILFKNQNLKTIESSAEKICYSFTEMKFDFMDRRTRLSASMGIAAYHSGMTSKEWFESADSAAYAAKSAGKNQFVVVL